MTPHQDDPAAGGGRDELDRAARDHYGTWRHRPLGLACLFVLAVLLLVNAVAWYGVVLLIRALT